MSEQRAPQHGKYPIDRPCSACSAGDYKMEYHDHDAPFREVAAPQPTNRHGERVSRECGAGHHAECKETLETCHCTYRGLHKTMHAYATFPGKPSAPQAESVPSGKDAALAGYLDQIGLKHTRKCVPFVINYLCMRCRVEVAAKAFLASQTAALAAAYDEAHPQLIKWAMICRTFDITDYKAACVADISNKVAALLTELAVSREGLKESLERVAGLERSNSLLRERITAAEGLLREVQSSAHPHPVEHPTMTKAWQKMAAYFSENKENQ